MPDGKRTQNAEDAAIELLLQQLRHAPPEAGSDFLGRVLADALDEQAAVAMAPRDAAAPAAAGWFARLLARFGGWGMAGGLVTAGLTGLWIGLAAPGLSSDLSGGLLGTSLSEDALSMSILPSYDSFAFASLAGEG